jgi:hypothetical protein
MRLLFIKFQIFIIAGLFICFIACPLGSSHAMIFEISKADTLMIAKRVFQNECSVEKDCLIEWNVGEEFLSLGLGHFIWYPANASGIYYESFRSYLQFAREAGVIIPVWLDKTPFPPCPWSSRNQFLNSTGSKQYADILNFMIKTKLCQADYLIENTKRSLQKIIDVAPQAQQLRISKYISQLSSNAQGLYALIDYVNFKGPGIGDSEKYKGEGWGLLQVLQGMRDMPTPQEVLAEFVRSAKVVLKHRVLIAPIDRHEEKWLPGWLNRMDTYLVIENSS